MVALKVLKNTLASNQPGRRFEREIAIPSCDCTTEASPSHFASAELIKGLAGHAPFMALEYIEGEHITRYADLKHLDPKDRIQLLLHVCDAISYAHSQGIIHRDLKPGNILVDASGFPKVLDFGLASDATKKAVTDSSPKTARAWERSITRARNRRVETTQQWTSGPTCTCSA